MAIAPALSGSYLPTPALRRTPRVPVDSIWRAPLVPVALALTAGIVIDRRGDLPWPVSLAFGLVSAVAGLAGLAGARKPLAWLYFLGVVAAFATLYHHAWRHLFPADDIGYLAPPDPRPARLRGILGEEPTVSLHPAHDPFRSYSRPDPTRTVLEVSQVHDGWDWQPASGKAQVVVEGKLAGFHVGDQVEVVGRLVKPSPPGNPGGADYQSFLLDRRIRAVLRVAKAPEGVVLREQGSSWSLCGALPLVQGWGCRTLEQTIPEQYYGVAGALLLGEDNLMMSRDWEKYKVTGVIHALAISGQHLAILAGFLWVMLRVLRVRRRPGAWFVGLFLLGYALLTGGRPPALRAAVTVGVLCLGVILRRPILRGNAFALAWIVVALVNPTDLFNPGCQLSFLAVAVLYWGAARWFRFPFDPLDRLTEQTEPPWVHLPRTCGRWVFLSYALTGVIWLTAAPLVAAHYHTVPLPGLMIGPIAIGLAAVALILGFLLLAASLFLWPLAQVLAHPTSWCLAGCETLVTWTSGLRVGRYYVADIPAWWLWGFYLGLLAVLWLEPLRQRWRWGLLAGLGWLCLGLLVGWLRPLPPELRCTFLAVGHGGCAVLETPDGRTLLYDTGSIAGPDLARQQVAPFLWGRGIRRIDEVFLSHADLDHFNGLLDLADRFPIGLVSLTPTFAKKDLEAVRRTMQGLQDRGIPVRQVRAGDVLRAGDLSMQVLHPPVAGPEGRENFRSLVLLVRHEGHSLLLTGDLEGPGMQQVLDLGLPQVDILMAPHHGSRAANTPALVGKVRPQVVVSCQGPPRGATRPADPGMAGGVPFLGTWPHGAVTITSSRDSLVVETFVTGQRVLLANRRLPPGD